MGKWADRDRKRAEREAEWVAQQQAEYEEQARKDALPIYDLIEEIGDIEDVKAVLHKIAIHVGLEEA